MADDLLKLDQDILVDEEGKEIIQAPPVAEPAVEEEETDASLATTDESHEDEEGHAGETEEDAEARRIRNRQRRQENKDRRRDYVDSLKRELAARDELLQQAMNRLDLVEKRTHGADLVAVDNELRKAGEAYNYFRQQHAQAVSASDGQLAVEAQEKMMQAANRAQQLANIKQAAQRPQNQPQPLDPRLKVQAETWLGKNSWYDPNGQDSDSQIALTVDQQLAREGWNPTTEQYWQELDSRLKKYLPHRYNSGYNRPTPRGAPVSGSGRDSGGGKTTGYRLSAERVTALKESGIWDDPKQRAEAIKRYQEFDKQQSA